MKKKVKVYSHFIRRTFRKTTSCAPFINGCNIAILNLLIDYGLSLQELTALTMHHVHFETNTLSIPATAGVERTITLAKEDKNNYIIITKASQNQFVLNTIVMIHYLSHSILTVEHTGGYMKMMHQRH